MPEFDELLSEVEKINTKVAELLRTRYADERRLILPLAYLNLGLDHHRAIIFLMRSQLYGSAMALVRLVFEAMIRAHWVAAGTCASDAQVDQIAENDNFTFPKMHSMAEAVDVAYSDPNGERIAFFSQIKKDAWTAMNSYTHSGLLQLARQFTGDRVEAKYPEQDLVSGLNASRASILLLGYLVARHTGQAAKADEIEKLFAFGDVD
jgi:hypothetical protein